MILSPLKGKLGVDYRITQKYGAAPEYYSKMSKGYWESHPGLDFAGKNPGDKPKLYAPYDLVCRERRENDPSGYGLMVDLETVADFKGVKRVLRFAHLEECDLQVGDMVKMLDPFAVMGNTGNSTNVHLHMELWHERYSVRSNDDNGNHGRINYEPYLIQWHR